MPPRAPRACAWCTRGSRTARPIPRPRCGCVWARAWWACPWRGGCSCWGGARGGGGGVVLFLLVADGMLQGQSVGKRIFGVKVMHLPTRSAARHRDSTLRNAPLALIVLLGMMPEPLGRVAFFAGLLVIGGVETLRLVRDPLGWRLGGTWAQTQVVDGKVVAGATTAVRSPVTPARVPGRFLSAARVRRYRSFTQSPRGKPCASR